MSWTEVYPVMDEGMVEEFENLETPEERAELEQWYGVEEIINPQDKRHLLAFSLFWKPSATEILSTTEPTGIQKISSFSGA